MSASRLSRPARTGTTYCRRFGRLKELFHIEEWLRLPAAAIKVKVPSPVFSGTV
jgi:hypothetical protein